MAALRQPPAACTAVVDAPRRTSSEAPASRVRRHTLEVERGSQDLDAAVDLVRAQRQDAVGRGGRRRRAQRIDGAGERAGEQPQVLASAIGVRLRRADAVPQLPGAPATSYRDPLC